MGYIAFQFISLIISAIWSTYTVCYISVMYLGSGGVAQPAIAGAPAPPPPAGGYAVPPAPPAPPQAPMTPRDARDARGPGDPRHLRDSGDPRDSDDPRDTVRAGHS